MWLGTVTSKLKWSEAKVKTEDDTGVEARGCNRDADAKFEVLEPEAAEDLWGLSNSKMLEVGAGDESEGFVKWNMEVSSIGDETLGFINLNIDVSAAGVSSDGEETGGFINWNIDMSAARAEVSSNEEETRGFLNSNIDVFAAGARVRFMNSKMELFNCWNSVWGVLYHVRSRLKLGKLTYVR